MKKAKRLRLELYKKALKDWSKDESPCTYSGFCHYFATIHYRSSIYSEFKKLLPELYAQKKLDQRRTARHYPLMGDTKTGRKQRVQALKDAIKLCE